MPHVSDDAVFAELWADAVVPPVCTLELYFDTFRALTALGVELLEIFCEVSKLLLFHLVYYVWMCSVRLSIYLDPVVHRTDRAL